MPINGIDEYVADGDGAIRAIVNKQYISAMVAENSIGIAGVAITRRAKFRAINIFTVAYGDQSVHNNG